MGVADLRAEAKFRSERVDQLIWGEEVVRIGAERSGYMKIRAPDGYEAYVMANSVKEVPGKIRSKVTRTFLSGDIRLPVGSLLTERDITALGIPQSYYRDTGYRVDKIRLARRYLGVPYLWGGGTEFGTDCSGLTQRVYGFNGLPLPRNADDQEKAGKIVAGLESAMPEDLVFFPGHVGMYIGGGMLLHSNLNSQRVSITDLNSKEDYSRRLRKDITSVRRYS